MNKYIVAQFDCKKWHSLTDLPSNKDSLSPKPPAESTVIVNKKKTDNPTTKSNTILLSISDDAKKLLYNILYNLHLSVRERIQALNFSVRSFENAKHDLITHGLIIESSAGRIKYLLPKAETFAHFNLACPYKNIDFIEHSFYLCLIKHVLKKNKYKAVALEYKLGTSGNTADIVAQEAESISAFELTFSASNIIQNCLKYDNTGFIKITFICRSNDLLKAVKSKVINAGLSLSLLSKLDFILLSSILKQKGDQHMK